MFIGVHLDKKAMMQGLEEALLTDAEMKAGPQSWRQLEDPFFSGQCAEAFFQLPSMR